MHVTHWIHYYRHLVQMYRPLADDLFHMYVVSQQLNTKSQSDYVTLRLKEFKNWVAVAQW